MLLDRTLALQIGPNAIGPLSNTFLNNKDCKSQSDSECEGSLALCSDVNSSTRGQSQGCVVVTTGNVYLLSIFSWQLILEEYTEKKK